MVFGQIVLLIIVSFLTCGGQICQKQAVDVWQSAQENAKRRGLYWLVLAVFLLSLGMLLWLKLLQVMPLNIAYPMLSINFVVVTLVAQFLYGERVTRKHWCGVAAIVTGVILMGAGH